MTDALKDPLVDDRIKAVLDAYQVRIDDENPRIQAMSQASQLTGDWRDEFLLAVGPDSGRLINILARSLRAPRIVELGTSFGYSGIWLAEAARATGGHLVTMELHPNKSAYAQARCEEAGLADHVDFQVGDALDLLEAFPHGIDFVLLDLWKDLYVPCLERFYPKLKSGAIIVALIGLLAQLQKAPVLLDQVDALPGHGRYLSACLLRKLRPGMIARFVTPGRAQGGEMRFDARSLDLSERRHVAALYAISVGPEQASPAWADVVSGRRLPQPARQVMSVEQGAGPIDLELEGRMRM